MAVVELKMPGPPNEWMPSEELTWVNDTTLAAYTSAETSDTLYLQGASRVELFINATPEAGQSIRLHIESGPNASDVGYRGNDGVWSGLGTRTYTFSDATNTKYSIILENVAQYAVVKYGYVGGTGADASLVIKVQGRRKI